MCIALSIATQDSNDGIYHYAWCCVSLFRDFSSAVACLNALVVFYVKQLCYGDFIACRSLGFLPNIVQIFVFQGVPPLFWVW